MDKYKKLKAIAHKDTVIGHLFSATTKILRHYISQVVLSALGTVVIALLIGFQINTFVLWIAVGFYLLLLFGILACQDYEKSLREDIKLTLRDEREQHAETKRRLENTRKQLQVNQHLVRSITVLHASAGRNIYRVAKYINCNGWYSDTSQLREVFGFQRMCMEVCKEIHDLCKGIHPEFIYYITVFQRLEGPKGHADVCRMIAYANEDGTEPLSFHKVYELRKPKKRQKQPLHNDIFLRGERTPRILLKQDIDIQFVWHPENKTREEAIKVYMGIPMSVCNRTITFILQLDCNDEDGFGTNNVERSEFAEQIIGPYALYLSMIYEFDRMNEMTDNCVRKMGRGTDGYS